MQKCTSICPYIGNKKLLSLQLSSNHSLARRRRTRHGIKAHLLAKHQGLISGHLGQELKKQSDCWHIILTKQCLAVPCDAAGQGLLHPRSGSSISCLGPFGIKNLVSFHVKQHGRSDLVGVLKSHSHRLVALTLAWSMILKPSSTIWRRNLVAYLRIYNLNWARRMLYLRVF